MQKEKRTPQVGDRVRIKDLNKIESPQEGKQTRADYSNLYGTVEEIITTNTYANNYKIMFTGGYDRDYAVFEDYMFDVINLITTKDMEIKVGDKVLIKCLNTIKSREDKLQEGTNLTYSSDPKTMKQYSNLEGVVIEVCRYSIQKWSPDYKVAILDGSGGIEYFEDYMFDVIGTVEKKENKASEDLEEPHELYKTLHALTVDLWVHSKCGLGYWKRLFQDNPLLGEVSIIEQLSFDNSEVGVLVADSADNTLYEIINLEEGVYNSSVFRMRIIIKSHITNRFYLITYEHNGLTSEVTDIEEVKVVLNYESI